MSLSLAQVHRVQGSFRGRTKAEAADLSGWLRHTNVSMSPFAKWRRTKMRRAPCEGNEEGLPFIEQSWLGCKAGRDTM